MLRVVSAVVVLVFSIFITTVSQAEGWYVGGAFGESEAKDLCKEFPASQGFDCDDEDSSLKIFAGRQVSENLGFEFGYIDFGEADVLDNVGDTADFEATGLTAAVVGTLPLGDKWTLFGKFGVVRWDTDVDINVAPFGSFSDSEDGIDPMYGFGVKYEFTDRISGRAEFETFQDVGDDVDGFTIDGESDIEVLSFGIEVGLK